MQGKYLLQKRKQPSSSITQISMFFTRAVINGLHIIILVYHCVEHPWQQFNRSVHSYCGFLSWNPYVFSINFSWCMEPDIQSTTSLRSQMDVQVFCMTLPQDIQEPSGKSDSTLDTFMCSLHKPTCLASKPASRCIYNRVHLKILGTDVYTYMPTNCSFVSSSSSWQTVT